MFNTYQLQPIAGAALWPHVMEKMPVVRVQLRVDPDVSGYFDNEKAAKLGMSLLEERRAAILQAIQGQRQNAWISALHQQRIEMEIDKFTHMTFLRAYGQEYVDILFKITGALAKKELDAAPYAMILFGGNKVAAFDIKTMTVVYVGVCKSGWGSDIMASCQAKFGAKVPTVAYCGFYADAKNRLHRHTKYSLTTTDGGKSLVGFVEGSTETLKINTKYLVDDLSPHHGTVDAAAVTGYPPMINSNGAVVYAQQDKFSFRRDGSVSYASFRNWMDETEHQRPAFAISKDGEYFYNLEALSPYALETITLYRGYPFEGGVGGGDFAYWVGRFDERPRFGEPTVAIHSMGDTVAGKAPWMVFRQVKGVDYFDIDYIDATITALPVKLFDTGLQYIGVYLPSYLFTPDPSKGYTWMQQIGADGRKWNILLTQVQLLQWLAKHPNFYVKYGKNDGYVWSFVSARLKFAQFDVTDDPIVKVEAYDIGGYNVPVGTIKVIAYPFPITTTRERVFGAEIIAPDVRGSMSLTGQASTPYTNYAPVSIRADHSALLGNAASVLQPEVFVPWFHASDGNDYAQGYIANGQRCIYVNGVDRSQLIAARLGVDRNNIQAMLLSIPLSRIKAFN